MEADEGRRYKSKKQKPCDGCRKRKICCVREPGHEICSLCRTKSQICTFESIPQARKGRTSRKSPVSNPDTTQRGRLTARNHEGKQSSSISEELPPSRPAKEWISQFVGSSVDQDPFLLRHCSFNDFNFYKQSDWACLRVNGNGGNATHFTLVPDSHLDARPRYYPKETIKDVLKEDPDQLLQTFFSVVHTSLPLLDPKYFMDDAEPGELLRAVIYEIASPYYLTREKPHDLAVLDWIFQVMPCEIRHPRLETVEAGLLFAQRHARYHRSPFTPGLWSEIGSLVGMSHDLGLNVDPSDWAVSRDDQSRRIRLWWAIFIQDKWCALGLGRQSYISDEQHNVPLPTIEDFPSSNYQDLPSPNIGILQFVGMATLTTILSDILSTFYSIRAPERIKTYTFDTLKSLIEEFQQRLDYFHDQHLIPLYNVEEFLDPTGTIFLAFYTVKLSLYKAGLRYFDSEHLQYHLLRDDVRVVLGQVTSLLQNMTVRRLRAFWWSQMSNINFSIAGGLMMSLLLTSTEDSEVEFWTDQIKLYHDLLQNQSVGFHITKLAAARMNLLGKVGSSIEGEIGLRRSLSGGDDDVRQLFCGDFHVDLIDT